MNPRDIPWKEIMDTVRFLGWIVVYVGILNLFKAMIQEMFPKFCRHCGKKASS